MNRKMLDRLNSWLDRIFTNQGPFPAMLMLVVIFLTLGIFGTVSFILILEILGWKFLMFVLGLTLVIYLAFVIYRQYKIDNHNKEIL
jgi:Ca2+/Na+ antiporter